MTVFWIVDAWFWMLFTLYLTYQRRKDLRFLQTLLGEKKQELQ